MKFLNIPGVDTPADIIDRLVIETLKVSQFENMKRDEQAKDEPDQEKIALWDNMSRDANEYRSMLKGAINKWVEELSRGEYKAPREARTFRPPND